jgi:cysteinyl-tRNA synthetase
MNITDVDDKIIRNSAQEGLSVKDYTAKYEKAFLEDSSTLNIEQPILARATEHIEEMARFIAELEKKGYAYRTEDGSYYFRIAKFPGYGKLSKKDFRRYGRWRARGCRRIRKGQRPRLCSVEGA